MAIVRVRLASGEVVDVPLRVIREGTEESGYLDGTECKVVSRGALTVGKGCVAGSKGFRIAEKVDNGDGTGTYTLEGYEGGYEVGDEYTVSFNVYYDRHGKIIAIDDDNKITVDNFPSDEVIENPVDEQNIFRVPDKPEVGNVDVGFCAIPFGEDNVADGIYSAAFGYGNRADGKFSFAAGQRNCVQYGGTAFGENNTVNGHNGFAAGRDNIVDGHVGAALGENNHIGSAFGENNKVPGMRALAIGHGNQAGGKQSFVGGDGSATDEAADQQFAFGEGVNANARLSVALGQRTKTDGECSLAGGKQSETNQDAKCSFAWGYGLQATGTPQAVFGRYNIVDWGHKYAFIVGKGTDENTRSNAFAVTWKGTIVFGQKEFTAEQLSSLLELPAQLEALNERIKTLEQGK